MGVTLSVVAVFFLVGSALGTLVDRPRAGILLAVLVSYPVNQWMLMKAIRRRYQNESSNESV